MPGHQTLAAVDNASRLQYCTTAAPWQYMRGGFHDSLGVNLHHANDPASVAVFCLMSADSSSQHLILDETGEPRSVSFFFSLLFFNKRLMLVSGKRCVLCDGCDAKWTYK